MDAKDLRIETALGERNDGTKYSQSGVALQCHRNKSYQDIGSNPLAKMEATVRPCAVIGPDRVVPPPASNDVYLKKASVDLWPCPDNLYPRLPEYPHKPLNNVNPTRNISPRQTFQEDMQRIMVPPTYGAVKQADESILNHDLNAELCKNKQTMAPEAKYCDVPYAMNLLSNEHKNVRETEMCVSSVNSPLSRTTPHGWPPTGVNLHAPRTYGTHDVHQYPQYPSCAGPRQTTPLARPHRTYQEEAGYVYPNSYYQDTSVRFKPYPSVKERYQQPRYDYISNYPNPFHPPPPYVPHKYDIPSTRPYPVYPHLKYLDNRVPDANIEGYQRANQQSISYNMQLRNQIIHPTYAPAQGNAQSKVTSYQPDTSVKSANKLSFDKAYVDYENAKAKYLLPDSYFVNEMGRVQVQKPVATPNYTSPGIHPAQMQQYHRKDNMGMKVCSEAYSRNMPHYRHFEHPMGFNPLGHHTPQFSPSTLAISPTDSNTSNGTSQEDCGYISQSSATSVRSVDSGISSRLHNEYYRRYDHRYRPPIGNPQMLPKSDLNPINSKENDKIDVRQFLSMWSEGDEDNTSNNNTKEITPKIADPNNYVRRHESVKNQDQLYVLGLVNVPNEELAKYEHIQKVSKLPENIKGYNNIELLKQFEEVIESSNMNSFKSSTPKDFFMKDRKNAIKQLVEALPRPVSPLDVEAKISQSVIHKEVGCNFEIKPCSPKMLNVEIAAPVQNILSERAIEKISNPLSIKSKSPLSMRIDGNTACNQIQRRENIHTTYENPSCKMVGSPFTANNMESVKTNYSLQDLETSSGVCLASLPRLDNEIELNFPEVNQQFINANKGDSNLLEEHSQELTENDIKLTTSTDNNITKMDPEKNINASTEEGSGTELPKLSKYRKSKINNLEFSEDESNANAIRTDSVIIENPENIRRIEENKERVCLHEALAEEENKPMNLTSQGSLREESNNIYSKKNETRVVECALDFSLTKSEEGLPIINANDDELIKTDTSNKPNKSIIVKNYRISKIGCRKKIVDDVTLSGLEQNTVCLKNPKKSEKITTTQVVKNITCENEVKKIGEIDLDKNKINLVDKSTSTNIIVKHKHKNNHKRSKANADVITTNFDQELRHKINQIGKGSLNKNYLKRKEEPSSLDNFGTHESSIHLADAKRLQPETNDTKTVIHDNILSDDYEQIEAAVSNICKAEVSKTNNLSGTISESVNHCEEKYDDRSNLDSSNNEEMVKICANTYSNQAAENHVSEKNYILKSISDNDDEINNTTRLICDKSKVLESSIEIDQANKYYYDLISESELFVDKTYCMDAHQSPSNSFVSEDNAFADNIKISDNSIARIFDCVDQNSDTKTNDQVLDDSKILEVDFATTRLEDCHKDSVSGKNKKSSIDNDELNIGSFDDVDSKKYEVTASVEKVTENNVTMTDCEPEETEIVEISTEIVDFEHHVTVPVLPDAELVDKKFSIDSGYQSNKNSFAENDESFIEVPENSIEDSVFDENISGSDQVTLNSCVENESYSKDTLQSVFKTSSKKTSTSSRLVNNSVIINKTSDDFNFDNEIEISPKTSQSSDLYDSVDAKMQILFEQPNEEIISKNLNSDVMVVNANIDDKNLNIDTKNYKNKKSKEHDRAPKISYFNKKYVGVDFDEQTLLDNQKELNQNEEIQINVENDNACKINTTVDSNFDVQPEVKISISSVMGHKGQIENGSNILSDSMEMVLDETCSKSFKEDESDTQVRNTLYTKRYSEYRSKKLYSPWIQKLFFYNEGIISNIRCLENISETKEQNHVEVNSLRKQNTDNVINVAMPDNDDDIAHYVGNTELIQDTVDLKIDTEYEKLNSESNSIKSRNNQSNPVFNSSMDPKSNFDVILSQENTIELNKGESGSTEKENKFENDCIEECDVQNDLIDTQEISFSYPNNSIISQITENIFNSNDSMLELKREDNNYKDDIKCGVTDIDRSPINGSRSLKRSFSDSALNTNVNRDNDHNIQVIDNMHYTWPIKRNRVGEFENFISNNRRNSVNIEENVSICILIDDNCIITEENEEKICIAELQEDYITEIDAENDADDYSSLKELYSSSLEPNVADSEILESEEENPVHESWVEDIACIETVYNDEVAENVVISAPSSPTDSASEYEHDESGIYSNDSNTCSHSDKVKFMHKEKMSYEDAQIVDELYRTPHMDIMNKTLLYGDKNVESDNNLTETDQENILLESNDWKPSPTHTPDYIDSAHASNDYRLETPENKENVFVKELSPLRKIDDYLDVSSAENETDDKTTQDSTVHSCESSLDNVFDYTLKDSESISTTTSTSYTTSSSPEVSSTTSEEKNSSILLKITNLNGSRVSQINEIETNNRPRCKFTENKEYSTSHLNFPNRPLLTKAAQKYIPPIKESIRDLKVKISLPQQSLLKLKQLKLSRSTQKVRKQHNVNPIIAKKPKPNFDDVLKSIDEIQIKRHKEKSKKAKTVVPKVVIKKNENGSHYASTPKKDMFSPDLTGRKWQPWVFIEKNNFIDKMATKNKTRAIYSHRKNNYVLAEKFKKYKSVGSTKFIISQPKTPGQLKYTIRLKHTY